MMYLHGLVFGGIVLFVSHSATLKTEVYDEIARRLLDRVDDLARRPSRAFLAGLTSPFFDIFKHRFQYIEQFNSSTQTGPGGFDLLVGHLGLGVDAVEVLAEALPLLSPDSPVFLSMFGHGSFAEFSSPPRLPDVREIGDRLGNAGLALPVLDRDRLTLRLANEDAARRLFEAHGWPLPPEGRFNFESLTIDIIYIHGHKKAPSQPRPAARGSGKVSLIKILHNTSDS